ncbi:UNVERIFIED_CONTAM: STAS domain-containing protein [Bacillus mycoides]
MMNLAINILQNDLGYTVQLNGEIDAYTASDLKNKVMPIASEKEVYIVVDFNKVDYMDSTGLGVFIALLKAIKKNDGKTAYDIALEKGYESLLHHLQEEVSL